MHASVKNLLVVNVKGLLRVQSPAEFGGFASHFDSGLSQAAKVARRSS